MPEQGLGFHIPSLIAYGVNFLLLLGILYLVGYKPILRMLNERSERIRESLDTAERVRQEAQQQTADLESQMAEARQQGQHMMAQAREAADHFRKEQQDRAKEEADALLTRARDEIRQERDKAIDEVRQNFGDLAILAAERVIQRSLDKDAHREIIEQVLQQSEDLQRH